MYFTVTQDDLETALRKSLRFDLGWTPDEARSIARILARYVTDRFGSLSE